MICHDNALSFAPFNKLVLFSSMVMLKEVEHRTKRARTDEAESESDKALVADAFKYKFVNSQNFVANFHSHIKFCLEKCHDDDSYSPYVALIQSSGYGKSRLIAEIAQDVYVLYVCF